MHDRYFSIRGSKTLPLLAAGLLALTLWLPASSSSAAESTNSGSKAKRVERSSTRSAERSAVRGSSRQSGSRARATATRPGSSSSTRSGNSSAAPRQVDRSDHYYRPGRSDSRYRGSYGRGYYGHYPYGYGYSPYSFYYGSSYRFHYYPGFSYYGYYPFPYFTWSNVGAYRGAYRGGGYESGDGWGALDFDVSPEKAKIFVDGQQVGVADNFDGFPAFLWLERGTYDVVIFKEGYQTIARQYTIYPGVVIDVEDQMTPGEAVMPEALASKSTVRRDDRLRRDRERVAEDRMRLRQDDRYDARGEPGRLELEVEPSDASIYLDGRFLGTAEDLSRLHSGLIVDPGEHHLQVVRPGYEDKEVEFEVEEGGEVTLKVTLDNN